MTLKRGLAFLLVFYVISLSHYIYSSSNSSLSEVSDLTGTDGRNTQSVPPLSILPSSPAININRYNQELVDQRAVKVAQLVLRSLDFYGGAVTGELDFETKISLIRFQSEYKIPISGSLDLITRKRLLEND